MKKKTYSTNKKKLEMKKNGDCMTEIEDFVFFSSLLVHSSLTSHRKNEKKSQYSTLSTHIIIVYSLLYASYVVCCSFFFVGGNMNISLCCLYTIYDENMNNNMQVYEIYYFMYLFHSTKSNFSSPKRNHNKGFSLLRDSFS